MFSAHLFSQTEKKKNSKFVILIAYKLGSVCSVYIPKKFDEDLLNLVFILIRYKLLLEACIIGNTIGDQSSNSELHFTKH